MTDAVILGPLDPTHRSRIEEIVRATAVFSSDEIAVAMEVFDDGTAHAAARAATGAVGVGDADYELLGAFLGGRLIGYACFGATPATDATYDLYWIAVDPAAQRSGAGAALMNEVEQRLAERRARLLVVETSSRDDYEPTRRFYAGHGYTEAARLKDFYSVGDDRVVFTKRVTHATGAAARIPLSA